MCICATIKNKVKKEVDKMKTKKVRITKSRKDSYWYSDQIGNVYTIREPLVTIPESYLVVENGRTYGKFIDVCDCVVLDDMFDTEVESVGDEYYVKVVSKDHDCYIEVSLVSSWCMQRAMGNHTVTNLLQFSELVVCNKTNDIIKCRGLIKDVVVGKYARPIMTITLE